jgi:kynureninase
MASFYRPTAQRWRILADAPTFPSDLYALQTQLIHHGRDPARDLVLAVPRPGEHLLREEDVEDILDRQGSEIAVVWLAGVNFLTGLFLDLPRLAAAAHRHGCVFGADLAHAAGNVPLRLHDWNIDFAVWCSYKYLNAGPGAVAGAFVHQLHGQRLDIPRLAGWWGNDPATRFRMHLEPAFGPRPGADGWQVSNPPILALAPVRAALALFDEAGMPALRAKSLRLTAYLLDLLDRLPPGRFELLSPRDPARRGCQVSLRVLDRPRAAQQALQAEGVVCDFREPDVIRGALAPLYNTFHDAWSFAGALARC